MNVCRLILSLTLGFAGLAAAHDEEPVSFGLEELRNLTEHGKTQIRAVPPEPTARGNKSTERYVRRLQDLRVDYKAIRMAEAALRQLESYPEVLETLWHLFATLEQAATQGWHVFWDSQGSAGATLASERRIVLDPYTVGLADPALGAAVLLHELQHVHDFLKGRPYALESEERGYKVNAIYMGTLKGGIMADSPADQSLLHKYSEIRRAYQGGPQTLRSYVLGLKSHDEIPTLEEELQLLKELGEEDGGKNIFERGVFTYFPASYRSVFTISSIQRELERTRNYDNSLR